MIHMKANLWFDRNSAKQIDELYYIGALVEVLPFKHMIRDNDANRAYFGLEMN